MSDQPKPWLNNLVDAKADLDVAQQQLVAERELREKITLSWTLSKSDNQQLRKQLAAARQPLVECLERCVSAIRHENGSSQMRACIEADVLLAKVKEGK